MELPSIQLEGKRKFLITLVVIACASVLVYFGKINSDNWVEGVKWVVGFFMGANVLKATSDKVKFEYINKKEE